ncbi:MAG: electron transfer flavoprotein subunit alpha/FixB family protein [Kiritimatiellaeota bacterium]|nr:electron transfer flavoprotein subunit alpha/FixB family protein [Kiritimatiellota bacterium]
MNKNDYKDIWIVAEQWEGEIQEISFELLTRGIALREQRSCALNVMVFGDDISERELRGLLARGADKVLFVKDPALKYFLVEPYAAAMLDIVEKYSPETILAGATSTGRTLMPYVAVKAHAGLTADCTSLEYDSETGDLLQTRPAIGGNIMATIKTPGHRPQMATVRPKSTSPAPILKKRGGEIVVETTTFTPISKIKKMKHIPNEDEISIQDAEKVVVVGRGLKKAENLPVVRAFADEIGAALGASRDVVDRGWLSYPHQVGLSGKTITPKLYIGLGVSGAIQHLAGMRTTENIIAVNIDPDAQIFKVADIGIVGDMFEVLPELAETLRKHEVKQ